MRDGCFSGYLKKTKMPYEPPPQNRFNKFSTSIIDYFDVTVSM